MASAMITRQAALLLLAAAAHAFMDMRDPEPGKDGDGMWKACMYSSECGAGNFCSSECKTGNCAATPSCQPCCPHCTSDMYLPPGESCGNTCGGYWSGDNFMCPATPPYMSDPEMDMKMACPQYTHFVYNTTVSPAWDTYCLGDHAMNQECINAEEAWVLDWASPMETKRHYTERFCMVRAPCPGVVLFEVGHLYGELPMACADIAANPTECRDTAFPDPYDQSKMDMMCAVQTDCPNAWHWLLFAMETPPTDVECNDLFMNPCMSTVEMHSMDMLAHAQNVCLGLYPGMGNIRRLRNKAGGAGSA